MEKSLRETNKANILLLLHKGSRQKADRPGQPKKYKQKQEAEIIALTCSNAPPGREHWTLELLTKAGKKKKGMETINRESIRLMCF